jgi:integrase
MGVKVKQWKGGWWVLINHKGRRKAKRVGSAVGPEGRRAKKAAELAAIKIQSKLAEGDTSVLDPHAPKTDTPKVPTFAEVAEEWLRKYPALHAIRPATLDNYRSFTERHLLPYFRAIPITEITPVIIEDFIEAKRAPGGSVRFDGKALADASLRTGLLALRLILQRAVRTKLIPANPMHEVEWRGLPRNDEQNVDPFTGSELRAILSGARSIDPDFATLVGLWVQSGMRAGEVSGLQWQDLDLERGTALVRRTWSRERLGPTKTGRERVVSMLHPVVDETPDWRPGATSAARLLLAGLRHLKVRSLDPEAFVFGRGDRPFSSMEVHRAWRRVLTKARVRYRSPEQFRHTFASTLLSRNAPLLYVQQQGGWRSATVLLRVYARWMPQDGVSGRQAGPLCDPQLRFGRAEALSDQTESGSVMARCDSISQP